MLFLVASDFMLYWLHRMFHGGGFWKYHAIHHSSEDLEWISAARFHPVNLFIGTILVDVILLMAGISPNIMLWVGPFTTFHSAFVHANLNWTLGPFKYVLATPVFHRWHHTSLEEGGNTNFAGTFPIWDILFGTFRMPERRLPDDYGVDDQDDPDRDRRAIGLSVPPIAHVQTRVPVREGTGNGGRFEPIARHGAGLERVMSIDATTIPVKSPASARCRRGCGLASASTCMLLINSSGLLNNSDTYWQIAVGQWILDHGALPRVDIYSFTKAGEPWISSSWLAQVLFAASYDLAGWTGPVVLASACIAATFALLAYILGRRIPATYAVVVTLAAMVLSMPHFLARPHVLVLPVMLAWANGLMSASERGERAVILAAAVDCALGKSARRVRLRPRSGRRVRDRRAVECAIRRNTGHWRCAGWYSASQPWRRAASRPTDGDRSSRHARSSILANCCS